MNVQLTYGIVYHHRNLTLDSQSDIRGTNLNPRSWSNDMGLGPNRTSGFGVIGGIGVAPIVPGTQTGRVGLEQPGLVVDHLSGQTKASAPCPH